MSDIASMRQPDKSLKGVYQILQPPRASLSSSPEPQPSCPVTGAVISPLSHRVSHDLTPVTLTFLLFLGTLSMLPLLPPASKLSGPSVWPFLVFRAVDIFLICMFQLKSLLLRQTQQPRCNRIDPSVFGSLSHLPSLGNGCPYRK